MSSDPCKEVPRGEGLDASSLFREGDDDDDDDDDDGDDDDDDDDDDAHKWNVLNRRFRSFAEGDGRRVAPRFHFVDTFDPGATTSKADGATTSPIDIL